MQKVPASHASRDESYWSKAQLGDVLTDFWGRVPRTPASTVASAKRTRAGDGGGGREEEAGARKQAPGAGARLLVAAAVAATPSFRRTGRCTVLPETASPASGSARGSPAATSDDEKTRATRKDTDLIARGWVGGAPWHGLRG